MVLGKSPYFNEPVYTVHIFCLSWHDQWKITNFCEKLNRKLNLVHYKVQSILLGDQRTIYMYMFSLQSFSWSNFIFHLMLIPIGIGFLHSLQILLLEINANWRRRAHLLKSSTSFFIHTDNQSMGSWSGHNVLLMSGGNLYHEMIPSL